ncbi:peptidase m16 inactive domain-containing protein [Cystoisospora suis]|uniref:Peptidase m16 inactive domain-containing protein n=1 Tax=Cystoisospora suis TaxID=483139 RepID=A0A2C6L9V8_9APIC|nr:peptidase m16 inactive domain-containing protein [Cystoisospora suis]
MVALIVQENIDKPNTDERRYRYVKLSNRLSVLLVSDPTADKAAAALDVNVGSYFDPRSCEGLAHMCEHMLFLGTRKFPDESEYANFIKQHGGSNNAYTEHTHTNFHFSVAPEHLGGALERFAEFFRSPLFTESATERELNAVDSEFRLRLVNDGIRRWHLMHKLANPHHPFNRFSCGNLVSLQQKPKELGVNLRQELLAFHEKWYSSNIMALVILGQDSLDKLQELAETFFEGIANKEVPVQPSRTIVDAGVEPFRKEDLGKLIYITPIEDLREIHFQFVIPSQIGAWRSKPTRYVAHLVGHEGKGSLLSALKKEGLAVGLNSWSLDEECVSIFYISIQLTREGASDEGLNRVEDLVFTYIQLLRTSPIQEWVFRESQALAETSFRFADKINPLRFCVAHAKCLHLYPAEYALSGAHLFFAYDPESIRDILRRLVVANLRLEVVGQWHRDVCTSKDDVYGVCYSVCDIPKKSRLRWEQMLNASTQEAEAAALREGLHYPAPNVFVPTDLSIRPVDSPCAHGSNGMLASSDRSLPRELSFPDGTEVSRNRSRIFFKQDDTFFLPKLSVRLWISSAFAARGLTEWICTRLYVATVSEMLTEKLYDAEVAGFHFYMSAKDWPGEISLTLHGFNDKLPLLLTMLTSALACSGHPSAVDQHPNGLIGETDQGLDKKSFEVVREDFHRRLSNLVKYRTVYQQAITALSAALEEPFYSYGEQLSALEGVCFEDVCDAGNQLFQRAHVTGILVGNMTEAEAVAMLENAVANLQIKEAGRRLAPKAVLNLSSLDAQHTASLGSAHGHCCPARYHDRSEADRECLDTTGCGQFQAGIMEDAQRKNAIVETAGAATRTACGRCRKEKAGQARDQKGETEDSRLSRLCRMVSSGVAHLRIGQDNSNPQDPNSAAFLRIQLGELSLRERTMLALFSHWIRQPFFDGLRTQQQLGYDARAHKSTQLWTHTADFFVASKFSPQILADRIAKFIEEHFGSREVLGAKMTEQLFELHRRALVSDLSVKPQNICDELQRYAVEVYFRYFLFDRPARMIDQLEAITREEFLDFVFEKIYRKPALLVSVTKQSTTDAPATCGTAPRCAPSTEKPGDSLENANAETEEGEAGLFGCWFNLQDPRAVRGLVKEKFEMLA